MYTKRFYVRYFSSHRLWYGWGSSEGGPETNPYQIPRVDCMVFKLICMCLEGYETKTRVTYYITLGISNFPL